MTDETVMLDKKLGKLPNVVCGYQLDTYEGMLMADTYQFRDKIKSSDLIHNANKLLCEYLEQAWTADRSIPYKNSYELLIAASLIEKSSTIA